MKERKAHRCSLLRNWPVKVLQRLIIFHDFSSSFAQEMNWFRLIQFSRTARVIHQFTQQDHHGLGTWPPSTGIVLTSAAHLFLLVSDIFIEITAQLLGRILLSLVMHSNSWDNLVVSYNLHIICYTIEASQLPKAVCSFLQLSSAKNRSTTKLWTCSCGTPGISESSRRSNWADSANHFQWKKKTHHWWFSHHFP